MVSNMKCPVICVMCGDIAELESMHFYTPYCKCAEYESCRHGVCDDCAEIAAFTYRNDEMEMIRELDGE